MDHNNEHHKDHDDIIIEDELLFDYWVTHLCFCEEDLIDSTIKIINIGKLNDQPNGHYPILLLILQVFGRVLFILGFDSLFK